MKNPTYPMNFRGGHMTKLAGQAASCAPDSSHGMPSAKALAVALLTASPLAMMGSPALAACDVLLPGITFCGDATTGTQTPVGGAFGFEVQMLPGSTLTTTTGRIDRT